MKQLHIRMIPWQCKDATQALTEEVIVREALYDNTRFGL